MEFIPVIHPITGGHIDTLTSAASPTAPAVDQTKRAALNNLAPAVQNIIDVRALLQAWRSGNSAGIAGSGLRLANNLTQGSIPELQLSSGALGFASSLYGFHQALNNGNTGAIITGGASLVINGATTYAYSQGYNSLSSAISDPIAENIFGNAGYAIKGIDSAVPYLNIANELVHGNYAGAGEDSDAEDDTKSTIDLVAACATFYWAGGLNDYKNQVANGGDWRVKA